MHVSNAQGFRLKIKYNNKKSFWGPTEIWTRIAGFKVQSANHYTMGPYSRKRKSMKSVTTQRRITQPSEHTTSSLKTKRNICSNKYFKSNWTFTIFVPFWDVTFAVCFFFLCLAYALSFAIQITLVSQVWGGGWGLFYMTVTGCSSTRLGV